MIVRIIGAIFIILGCTGFGIISAAVHQKTVKAIKELLHGIAYLENELQYRITPLPELLSRTANACTGPVSRFFHTFAREMESQIYPNVPLCAEAALPKIKDMPPLCRDCVQLLTASLGQFDLEGQIRSLAAVKSECTDRLNTLTQNQDVRLRSYQTLALCAGAALVILFI